jgi:RNA polymerase sigma-70 factor (ECF subfamily)
MQTAASTCKIFNFLFKITFKCSYPFGLSATYVLLLRLAVQKGEDNLMIENEFFSILDRARKNESFAQEKIIRLYQKRVSGFVYSMIGRFDELEDVTQTIFIKMILNLCKLRDPAQFEPWLFTLARNSCMDFLRKKKLKNIFTAFLPEHDEIPAGPEDACPEQREWLQQALRDLPPKQRELLVLQHDKNYSYEELAKITGSTVSSVKSRLFRAREALLERRENELGKGSLDTIAGACPSAIES